MSEPVDFDKLVDALEAMRADNAPREAVRHFLRAAFHVMREESPRLLPTGAAGERCLVCRAPSQAECAWSGDEPCGPFVASTPAREPVAVEDVLPPTYIDNVAHTCAVRYQRESHMTLEQHIAHTVRMAFNDYAEAVRRRLTHPPTPEAGTVTEAVSAFLSTVGCGDHSCLFVKPQGMGTNGSCRCSRKPGFPERVARLVNALAGRRGA